MKKIWKQVDGKNGWSKKDGNGSPWECTKPMPGGGCITKNLKNKRDAINFIK
ncbi:MAG: hypothetical protein WC451_05280 [Patescibacteria group bacterium]